MSEPTKNTAREIVRAMFRDESSHGWTNYSTFITNAVLRHVKPSGLSYWSVPENQAHYAVRHILEGRLLDAIAQALAAERERAVAETIERCAAIVRDQSFYLPGSAHQNIAGTRQWLKDEIVDKIRALLAPREGA